MKLVKNYSLSITLFVLFIVSWLGQSYFQWQTEKTQAEEHGSEIKTEDYTNSFLASTFENWQSEFLQLFTMVVLTSLLIHKGSPESKDSDTEVKNALNRIEKKLASKK